MTYPRKQRAGRPHLLVYSVEQEAIEAIQLDEVGTNVPAPIAKFLRTYQIEGIKFLYRQYASGKGGVLGDDMGLGKTIQVIGFLAAVMRESPFHLDIAHTLRQIQPPAIRSEDAQDEGQRVGAFQGRDDTLQDRSDVLDHLPRHGDWELEARTGEGASSRPSMGSS